MTSQTRDRSRIGQGHFVALVSMIMALTALAIDLMLPAFPEIRRAFGLAPDATDVAAILTTFFLGLAVGMLFYGTLADRFGRRPILYVGFAIYALGAVASALAPSLEAVLVARFVWGLGAAGPRTLAITIVRDRYDGDQMARVMSFVMAIFIVIPIVAPAVGKLIVTIAPWQFIFWFCVVFVGAIALWANRLPETLAPEHRIAIDRADVTMAIRRVVTTRETVGFTLVMTALFGAFTSFLGSSEIIIAEVFDLEQWFPLIFASVATVMGAMMLLNASLVSRWGARRVVHRAMTGYLAAALGLYLIATVTDGSPSLWVFLLSLGAILSMFALLIPNMNTLAMQPVGEVAGTASAFIGFVSTAGGASLGAVIDRAFDGTVLPLSTGFALAGIVGFGLLAWTERGRLTLARR